MDGSWWLGAGWQERVYESRVMGIDTGVIGVVHEVWLLEGWVKR